MKKLSNLFVLLIVLITVFTSCTKDISGPVDVNFAEGKWNFDKSTVSSGIITLPYTNDFLRNEDGCSNDYIELLPGGVAKSGDYAAGCSFSQKEGIWSTSGTNLIMAIPGSTVNGTFEIASLSATELILRLTGTFEGKSGSLNMYFKK